MFPTPDSQRNKNETSSDAIARVEKRGESSRSKQQPHGDSYQKRRNHQHMHCKEARECQSRDLTASEQPEPRVSTGERKSGHQAFSNTSAEKRARVPGEGITGATRGHHEREDHDGYDPLRFAEYVSLVQKELNEVKEYKEREPLRAVVMQRAQPRTGRN